MKQAHPDMMSRMTMISEEYIKKTTKLFFLAFCGTIYLNLLHGWVYIRDVKRLSVYRLSFIFLVLVFKFQKSIIVSNLGLSS